MLDFFRRLFADDGFMPHGHCYLWRPEVVWLHVGSDALIALAYYSIPLTLFYFVRRRQDLTFRWVFVMFAAFILACGTTHLLEIWTLWTPTYRLEGVVKAATAAVSMATAVALVPLVPRALALPSPAELDAANATLRAEVEERRRVQAELRTLSLDLERQVRARTAELEQANAELRAEMAERQRIEGVVREREERFRMAVEAAPNAMIMVDADGQIHLANAEAARLFGYALDELNGMGIEALVPEAVRVLHRRERELFLADPRTRSMGAGRDLHGLRRDGVEVPVEIGLNPLTTEEGVFVLAAVIDITERKRAADALAAQAAELERSNADLAEFAYVASHDLQEPLRVVANYTQLLARRYGDALDDDAQRYIARANDGVARMRALIRDLLDYSRVDTRQREHEPVDCERLLREVLAALETAIAESGASIEIGPMPTVMADGAQLRRVFLNLLSNAIKFRGEEPPRIAVTAARGDGAWQFAVRDNGIGLNAKHAERIFAIFQRLHPRDTYPGTGIGLALCRKIVERHGGRITVESEPGEGATFHFTVPAP